MTRGTRLVWSISYAGGVVRATPGGSEDVSRVYSFLRKALREIREDRPFRGPSQFVEDEFEYRNQAVGSIETFWGSERITQNRAMVYRLRYAGGSID